MTLKTELTSDGKHVMLRGRVKPQIQEWLVPYRLRHMTYKVPIDVFCTPGWRLKHEAEVLPERLLELARRDPSPTYASNDIMEGLYPFQQESVRHIIGTLKGRALLADDMGLGKTIQAIALMKHYGPPYLVICPAFLKSNWVTCAHERGLGPVTVVSYDSLRKNNMSHTEWNTIVVDEAHYIKQKDALRTQAALPLIMNTKYAILCTGTPCPSRCEELFTLMHALRPSIVSSFRWFAMRYCNARRTRFCAFDTTGKSRQDELKWLLNRAFMVRRRKADVLDQLPPKHQSRVWVQCTQRWRIRISEMQEKFEDAIGEGKMNTAKCIVSEMFRATCQAKLVPAVEYAVATIQKCNSCCIVFAHHAAMLDALEAATKDLKTVRIDGKTPMHKRELAVKEIQAGNVRAALLSMGAAGVGLTMTCANRVLFAELPWTPATLRQCEDRVHRLGQTNSCFITYIMADDTLDQHIWDSIQGKETFINKLM
tara:strand:+ start:7558 stop:9003 length:1446 start_codon:yes stop_codon:yes gene_type:complete